MIDIPTHGQFDVVCAVCKDVLAARFAEGKIEAHTNCSCQVASLDELLAKAERAPESEGT